MGQQRSFRNDGLAASGTVGGEKDFLRGFDKQQLLRNAEQRSSLWSTHRVANTMIIFGSEWVLVDGEQRGEGFFCGALTNNSFCEMLNKEVAYGALTVLQTL